MRPCVLLIKLFILVAVATLVYLIPSRHYYINAQEPITLEEYIEETIRATFHEEPNVALDIARCESELNPEALNDVAPDYSVGIFQVNIHGELSKTRPSEEWLKDPDNNIRYARELYDEVGWSAWSCYKKVTLK